MSREFRNLVREALKIEMEFRAACNCRMSSKAWVAYLIETSEKTPQEYEDFKARLELKTYDQLPDLFSYINSVEHGICRGDYPRSPPGPKHMAVLRGISSPDTYRNAKDQAEALGGNLWLTWAIAAERAAIKRPSLFGTDTDPHACESRVNQLKLKRSVLLPKIVDSWQNDDVIIHEIRSDGAALITYACAMPHLLPIAPLRDSGERLISYLADQPDFGKWAA